MSSHHRRAGSGLLKRRGALAGCAAVVALGAVPAAASAAPTGAFTSDNGATSVYQLTISASQTLSFNGSVTAGDGPMYEAATPDGKYLYVGDDGTDFGGTGTTLSQYKIGSGGTLTPLSPATVATGSGPAQIAVSPDGKNLYAANFSAPSLTEYSIASDGTLSLIGTITSGLQYVEGVAVSPDGSSVYAADPQSAQVLEYNRNSNGTLTPKSPASVPFTGGYASEISITPDGRYLYASGDNAGINQYSVGSGGQLTPLAVPNAPISGAIGMVMSPNGQNVYDSDYTDNNIYQFRVGSGGELTPLSPATVPTDGYGMPWITADGSTFYVPDYKQSVYQFSVGSSGALSPKTPATVSQSGASTLFAVAIPPDQGPTASFSAKVAPSGKASTFNASSSTDSDGKVVSYHWSFGDGESLTTTNAQVSHTYGKAGTDTVTLTVTDDSGCSTSQVFTGQTAYCNGTSAATASQTVKIAAAASKRTLKLSVTPHRAQAGHKTCYAFRATSKGHGVRKVTVRLAGHHATTSGSGRARICLKLKKGTYTAHATRKGYRAAAARITVRAARPAFTG